MHRIQIQFKKDKHALLLLFVPPLMPSFFPYLFSSMFAKKHNLNPFMNHDLKKKKVERSQFHKMNRAKKKIRS